MTYLHFNQLEQKVNNDQSGPVNPKIQEDMGLFEYYFSIGVFGELFQKANNSGVTPSTESEKATDPFFEIIEPGEPAVIPQTEKTESIKEETATNEHSDGDELDHWAVSLAGIPLGVTRQEVEEMLSSCGEVVDVRPSGQNDMVIEFSEKLGAMNALRQRIFTIEEEIIRIYAANTDLRLVMQYFPPATDENQLEELVTQFLSLNKRDIFIFVEFVTSHKEKIAFLSFLTERELREASILFSDGAFTQFIIQQLRIPEEQRGFIVRCVKYIPREIREEHNQTQKQKDTKDKILSKSSIYLSELPYSATEAQIRSELAQFGPIKYVNIYKQLSSKGKRPCATCYFELQSSAQSAIIQGRVKIGDQSARISEHFKKRDV